ncbi:MAG: hypothetical protein HGA67_00295 [Candidatus Yonathbacteria bacterium]|nr:hypothetical protein [Candidatus Yonathbacteria bacterium]
MNIDYFNENPELPEYIARYLDMICPFDKKMIINHRKSWDPLSPKDVSSCGMILIAIPQLADYERHPASNLIKCARESGYTGPIIIHTSEETEKKILERDTFKRHHVTIVSGQDCLDHIAHFLLKTPVILFLEQKRHPDLPHMLAKLEKICIVHVAPDPSVALEMFNAHKTDIDGYLLVYDVPSARRITVDDLILAIVDTTPEKPIVIASKKPTYSLSGRLNTRRKKGVDIRVTKVSKYDALETFLGILIKNT